MMKNWEATATNLPRKHALMAGLRLGASGLAFFAAMGATSAFAQDAAPAAETSDEGDEIIVSGIRASLDSSRAIKKNSSEIVDSVTAEDIGALPDRSVTETL
jgi:hypothetical protein